MAGAFGASALWAPGWPLLAAACWLACCAVPLAFIDARSHRLPNPLTMAAFGGTVLFLLLAASATGNWPYLGRAVTGGVVLAGCYAALAAAGAVGLGDAKIAASVGALLAWAGWVPLAAGAFAAFLLAFPCAAVMLIRRSAGAGRRRMAFGPFIVAGTFLTLAVLGTSAR
jgi:leader peptidase (prepilin peptidase)/N-methyltransferase